MAEPVAHYTFVPWLRRGLGASIPVADDLGTGAATGVGRVEIPIEVSVAYDPIDAAAPVTAPAIGRQVALLGPGDVLGLEPQAVIRTEPIDGATGVPATHLAYLDFYEEDLPWRYTPAAAANATAPEAQRFKLRPWLALWVLAEDELVRLPDRTGLPRAIRLTADAAARALPRHDETWAWAHVQISRALGSTTEVDAAVRDAPEHALARLVSPRRLRSDTSYRAVVVPAFEVGRLAGLGEDPSAVPAQAPSWRTGAMPHSAVRPLEYPVYVEWSFRTGQLGDFETLVRALVPGPVGERFGRRTLDIAAPGFGLDGAGAATVEVEGALMPPGMPREPFPAAPGAAVAARLETVLDLAAGLERGEADGAAHPYHVPDDAGAYPADLPADPIVTPPIYGRHHARTEHRPVPERIPALAELRDDAVLAWLRELNLDPRSRVASGLGAAVIQDRQEELVERAWEQVGDLAAANRTLRRAELALAVSSAMFTKHVLHPDPERTVRLTAAAHRRVRGTGATTVATEIAQSRVPSAALSAAWKRATRPQRTVVRRVVGGGNVDPLHRDLVTRFNRDTAALSAAPPLPPAANALALGAVTDAVAASIVEYDTEGARAGLVFLELAADELRARIAADPAVDLSTAPLAPIRAGIRARLDARIPAATATPTEVAVRAGAISLITAIAQLVHDRATHSLELVLPAPVFASAYGAGIAGKAYGGVTAVPDTGGAGEIATMTAAGELAAFAATLAEFRAAVVEARPDPAPPPALSGVATIAQRAATGLDPRRSLGQRVASAIRGVGAPTDPARPLRPVMAHPAFPDPMFEDLRRSGDFVIPNYGDLAPNTITILEPNRRFIEAYLAGLNDEMARELLWREYPTDQRGSYFTRFWDARDADGDGDRTDITAMHTWSGQLGEQAPAATNYLVLVIRGELLRRYPSTLVYLRRAAFAAAGTDAPRVLAPDGAPGSVLAPAFRGSLDPDITLIGFAIGVEQAKGHRPAPGDPRPADPGWFVVLEERPGEVAFGLDDAGAGAPGPLESWDDLTWAHLTFPADSPEAIAIRANAPVLAPMGDPTLPRAAQWGRTAADLAYILLQDPVQYARHAEELLP